MITTTAASEPKGPILSAALLAEEVPGTEFHEENAAQAWLAYRKWDGPPCCPSCGSLDTETTPDPNLPWRCVGKTCGKRFSVKTGTIFEGVDIRCRDLVRVLQLLALFPREVSAASLSRALALPAKQAWHLLHRIARRHEAREMITYAWLDVADGSSATAAVDGENAIRRFGKAVVVAGRLRSDASPCFGDAFWDALRRREMPK